MITTLFHSWEIWEQRYPPLSALPMWFRMVFKAFYDSIVCSQFIVKLIAAPVELHSLTCAAFHSVEVYIVN